MGDQHTPGIWRVQGPATYKNPNVGLWSVEGHSNVANDCTLADARLIAAAPDLLNAAERVIAAHDEVSAWMALGWPARTLVQEPNRNTARAAFDCLRAAYAKATSPTPQPTEGNGG